MPLSKKGKRVMEAMREEYGEGKGERVFYASKNKGRIKGVEKGGKKHMMKHPSKHDMMKSLKERADEA